MDSILGLIFLFAFGQHICGPIMDSVILRFERRKRAGH